MIDTRPGHPLEPHLRRAALELAREVPPADLRDRIAHAVRRAEPARPWWRPALAWGGFATAAIALFVVLLVVSAPADDEAEVFAADFVPVGTTDRWRDAVARGTAWLVAAELPQARLAALGLPYDPARAEESVRAQLLVESSGDVLAVRVIR